MSGPEQTYINTSIVPVPERYIEVLEAWLDAPYGEPFPRWALAGLMNNIFPYRKHHTIVPTMTLIEDSVEHD